MKILVDRCVVVYGYTRSQFDEIKERFSLFNIQYRKAKYSGRSVYNIPENYEYFLEDDRKGQLFLPSSSFIILKKLFPDALIKYNVSFEKNDGIELVEKIIPRDFQAEAIKVVGKKSRGIFKIPTGGGKTIFGMMVTRKVRVNTLIICDTTQVYNQWVASVEKFFGIKCGQIKGKKLDIQPITVAMSQTLSNKRDAIIEHKNYFGMMLVDECQGIGPNNKAGKKKTVFELQQYYNRMGRVVQWFNARVKYGLTDAAMRSDEQDECINYALGPVIYETPYDELEKENAVIKPKLIVRRTNFELSQNIEDPLEQYVDCCWEIIKDNDRTKMVVSDLMDNYEHYNLVLANNKAYVRLIAGALIEKCPPLNSKVVILTSGTPLNLRNEYIEKMKNREINYLFATSLADKGMDIPCLDRLYLPFPGKFEGTYKQKLGRVVRFEEAKDGAIVYDYTDFNVTLFRAQFIKRAVDTYSGRCIIDFEDDTIVKCKIRKKIDKKK